MPSDLSQAITALAGLSVKALQSRYTELFADVAPTHNRRWLVKQIAWRMQALAEGDLSQRARQRAVELAQHADVRLSAPKVHGEKDLPLGGAAGGARDTRLPLPGTRLIRLYKGQTVQVEVLERGFAYDGKVYSSLSAVAKAISGQHANGYLFFGLARRTNRKPIGGSPR